MLFETKILENVAKIEISTYTIPIIIQCDLLDDLEQSRIQIVRFVVWRIITWFCDLSLVGRLQHDGLEYFRNYQYTCFARQWERSSPAASFAATSTSMPRRIVDVIIGSGSGSSDSFGT